MRDLYFSSFKVNGLFRIIFFFLTLRILDSFKLILLLLLTLKIRKEKMKNLSFKANKKKKGCLKFQFIFLNLNVLKITSQLYQ